jgi:hypothetical protein
VADLDLSEPKPVDESVPRLDVEPPKGGTVRYDEDDDELPPVRGTRVGETQNGEVTDDAGTSAATAAQLHAPTSTGPVGIDPPTHPTLGDPDGGAGQWVHVQSRGSGAAYQEHVTGILRNPDGSTTEYRMPYDNPKSGGHPYVDFDGHVWRGQPPQEVFQEAKDGYPYVADPESFIGQAALAQMDQEATGQLAALRQSSPNAKLEWYFSSQEAADFMNEHFENVGIDVFCTA